MSPQNITYLSTHRLAALSRVTDDLWDSWAALKSHIATAIEFLPFFIAAESDPLATLPDLDMLPIGEVMHGGVLSPSSLTADEQRLLVSLWAWVGAPLIMGGALPPLSNDTLALLAYPGVLGMHRASHGLAIAPATSSPSTPDAHAFFSFPNEDETGSSANLVLVNAGEVAAAVGVPSLTVVGLSAGTYCATDVWTGAGVGGPVSAADAWAAPLPPHAVGVYRFHATSGGC